MTTFQAKISHLPSASAPEEYDPSKRRIPLDDFIVSRNKDGSALSRYGDLSWDRTPYHAHGGEFFLHFNFWHQGDLTLQRGQLARELRWLMFILIYLKPGHALANASLRGYMQLFHSVARFCESRSLRIQDVLADPLLVFESLGDNIYLAKNLSTLIKLLMTLGPDIVGFDVVNNKAIQELRKINARWVAGNKQHPPIPTRLYSSILSALAQEIDEFQRVADRVLALFKECVDDPLIGRSRAHQFKAKKKLKLENETRRPEFSELLLKYDLVEFWSKRSYEESLNGLSTTLTEVLTTASLQIQAFTGMRRNEVRALPHHCLDEIKREEDGRIHYIVKGRVTKLTHGKIKRVQWVTSESGRDAILLVQRISLAIYKANGETPKKSNDRINSHHLFISPHYATHVSGTNDPASILLLSVPILRARLQPIIKEEDLLELEEIDKHRAWRTEDEFQIGQPWRLTTHQLRRSLALYAQRSGLVSLPSLKRQLQHITQEMSLYYARGSAFAANFIGDGHKEKHFGAEWQETQPISQYLSYAAHVLLADEPDLFGVHPHWITSRLRNNDGIVVFDRAATLKRFKKGEMAYRETLLGGCVKIGECDKNPLDLLHVDCITSHCKSMVGSKKKLERVITVQGNLVEWLKKTDPASPEYRHEKSSLDVLKTTLENITKGPEGSEEAV